MRHVTVVEWVSIRPIFDVCTREMGYEGRGILQVSWRMQKVEEDNLRVTVEAILAAVRVRRRQKPGRRDGREGGSEGGSTDSKG